MTRAKLLFTLLSVVCAMSPAIANALYTRCCGAQGFFTSLTLAIIPQLAQAERNSSESRKIDDEFFAPLSSAEPQRPARAVSTRKPVTILTHSASSGSQPTGLPARRYRLQWWRNTTDNQGHPHSRMPLA